MPRRNLTGTSPEFVIRVSTMPEITLTVAFLSALLPCTLLGSRRTPRGRRIFQNRYGVLFRGRFRRHFFHPARRHGRRRRHNGLRGRRRCASFIGMQDFFERRNPNRRRDRQGRSGRRQRHGSGYGMEFDLDRSYYFRPGGHPGAGPSTDPVAPMALVPAASPRDARLPHQLRPSSPQGCSGHRP
ncbi:hypothetical protein PR202_ga04681 [Eleusine coracana subsp. coracana]|uniref:Uncharacterized protein n=1 Tax=Eleusine coracana subsp. coracana TaxID=191504 RepID=A0AAV5BSV2_ELECO|nr:hypothetical protein PR202_ga04681 [Eleusine coracana subsp. coracana]